MPKDGKKIIAVIPARNAAKTIEWVIDDIPKDWVDGIFLSDNASKDETVVLAAARGVTVFRHSTDRGYRGNQKHQQIATFLREKGLRAGDKVAVVGIIFMRGRPCGLGWRG